MKPFSSSLCSQVITIFSASNYYAIGSNKGAYLRLDPHLEPHYVQYISQASKTKSLTFREKIGFIESSALRELGAKLRDNREDLENFFLKNDRRKTGKFDVLNFYLLFPLLKCQQ